MPSAAKVYSARLSAAVCHAREAWELRLEQLEMEGIPKGITHAQLHWRRKGHSSKPGQTTGIAAVAHLSSDASEVATGTAGWAGDVLTQHASIGISSAGKPIPKYYELVVKGRSLGNHHQADSGDGPFHTLGKLTVDVARFCHTADNPHGRPTALELAMKPNGSLRVTVSASRVHDSALLSRLHSNMSLGSSDISELTEDLEDVTVITDHGNHQSMSSLRQPLPLHHDNNDTSLVHVPERRCKSEATLECSNDTYSTIMSLDEEEDDDVDQSQKKRNASLNRDEVEYYLRALASDDSGDDETSRKAAGPFGWLRVCKADILLKNDNIRGQLRGERMRSAAK